MSMTSITLGLVLSLTVTVYHSTPTQTDGDPLTTADGTRVVNVDTQRIAAVSREHLWYNGGDLRYGDGLWVDVPDDRVSGVWCLHDTTATEVFRDGEIQPVLNYLDLLVDESVYDRWEQISVTVVEFPDGQDCDEYLRRANGRDVRESGDGPGIHRGFQEGERWGIAVPQRDFASSRLRWRQSIQRSAAARYTRGEGVDCEIRPQGFNPLHHGCRW